MAERRVLLIDSDEKFHHELQRILAPYAVEVVAVDDGSDGLSRAGDIGPELIVIAVDLPDKVGYATCNKAKKGIAKHLPVMLATATIPAADLVQHRKLKVHADEYVDKRNTSEYELLAKIDSMIGLGPAIEDVPLEEVPLEDLNVDSEEIAFDDHDDFPAESTSVGPGMVDPGIDAETDAVFAGLVEQTPTPAPADEEAARPSHLADADAAPSSPPLAGDPVADGTFDLGLEAVVLAAESAEKVAQLEAEVHSLRGQLEEARRPPSGPAPVTTFSREREFLNLREVINRKEKDLLDLKDELDAKDRLILGGKEKIRELERKQRESEEKSLHFEGELVNTREAMAGLRDDKEKAVEREKGLKARIDLSQAQLKRADEEFEALKRKNAAEAQAARDEVNAKRQELEREKKEVAAQVASLQAELAAALIKAEADKQSALRALEKQYSDEHDATIATLRHELNDAVDRLKREHLGELAAYRDENEKQVLRVQAEHAEAMARADKDHQAALAKVTEDKAQAVAASDERRKRELVDNDEMWRAEAKAAERRREKDLATREEEHKRAAADAAALHQAGLEKAEKEARDLLAAAKEQHARELAEAETRRQAELATAEAGHAEVLAVLGQRHEAQRAAQLERIEALTAETAKLADAHARSETRGRELDGELARASNALGERQERLAKLERDLADREAKLSVLRKEQEQLEREHGDVQEQLLKAFQKLRADEIVVTKAKKALALALTLLDAELSPPAPPASPASKD